ncbi:MAG: prepilin-type N-terminal cleavage/methylation domain-containing protein [Armatimonadota bacterium]|nr:prepilin-type N-terminal cleavage/methylation domain-containing protein [Armatimonadota bacterium]
MISRRAQACRRSGGQRGFTLIEVMIGMLLLASIVVMLAQGYMAALSRAGETGDHTMAAAWAQAMVDYLRNQGYGVSGSWSETPAACAAPKPCLPPVFSRADIVVSNTGIPSLKQIDITLYRMGSGSPFMALSTYAADLRFP